MRPGHFQGKRRVPHVIERHRAVRPIFRRKRDAPGISGHFKFQANLKKFANRPRPLHPNHAPFRALRLAAGFRLRNIQLHDRIFGDVMLRLVFAAMAIHHDRRRPFFKRLPERIRTRYCDRDRLHDARAAALLRARFVGWQ